MKNIFWITAYRILRNSSLNSPSGLNISESGDRIVGGEYADIREFPHQIALEIYNEISCGGSIISEDWVLTAAHCVDKFFTITAFTIRSGSSSISRGGTVHEVSEIIIHEGFHVYQKRSVNDIALVRVNPRFNFNGRTCQAIPLINAGEKIKPGTMACVTGWGITEQFVISDVLRKVHVPIISPEKCDSYGMGPLSEGEICAGYEEGGRDACQADSGGPLAVENLLVGIVSWGYGCAQPRLPGVYVEVAYYRDWIKKKTGI